MYYFSLPLINDEFKDIDILYVNGKLVIASLPRKILTIFSSPEGSSNKSENMRNSENIGHIVLGIM